MLKKLWLVLKAVLIQMMQKLFVELPRSEFLDFVLLNKVLSYSKTVANIFQRICVYVKFWPWTLTKRAYFSREQIFHSY